MIRSRILTKHMPCECKCKFDGKKYNSNQKLNNNKCRYECRKYHVYHVIYMIYQIYYMYHISNIIYEKIRILLRLVAKTTNF